MFEKELAEYLTIKLDDYSYENNIFVGILKQIKTMPLLDIIMSGSYQPESQLTQINNYKPIITLYLYASSYEEASKELNKIADILSEKEFILPHYRVLFSYKNSEPTFLKYEDNRYIFNCNLRFVTQKIN